MRSVLSQARGGAGACRYTTTAALFLLLITTPAPAAQPPATAPATRPAVLEAEEARLKANHTRHLRLPERPAVNELDDLLTLSTDSAGLLVARFAASPSDPRLHVRVKVRDVPGASFEVTSQGSFTAVNGRPAVPLPSVYRFDFDAPRESQDAIWSARLDAADGYLRVTGQSVSGRYVLLQNQGVLTFTYRRLDNAQAFKAQVNSLRDLQAKHPKEFDEHLVPLLSKFSALPFLRPGPAEVYAVFSELEADEAVINRVLDLLPQLAAEEPGQREAASRALSALGPTGVLAVMRLNEQRTGPLVGEQQSRLRALVDDARRFSAAQFDPQAARSDPEFLADCLENPDLAVRTLAKREIERVLGRPVEYDLNLPPNARRAAADAVRKGLPKRDVSSRPAPES